MKLHELKCWPEPFEAVRNGIKPFELRRDDGRGFERGDRLLIKEWDAFRHIFTGRKIGAEIGYVCRVTDWAPDAPADLVVLGLINLC